MRNANRLALTLTGVVLATPALAQLSPGPNPVTGAVGQQTLSGGTGSVANTGTISVSNGSQALTMTGTSTLNNDGAIQQTGSGRAIDSNSGTAELTVNNTGTISAVSSDAIRVNTSGSSVSLTNSGTISVSAGGQAIDWAAITTGTNTLTNQATGVISVVGEDAVRPGQNGTITNAGLITATPNVSGGDASGSDGIDLRTQKTVTVTNSGTITGRHGIATDGTNAGPSSLTVNNLAGGVLQGMNGSGINIDASAPAQATSVTANVTNAQGASIRGGVLAATTSGDGDGIDVDGVLTLNNSGDVLGLGAKGLGSDGGANTAEGVAIGGGTIINTATGRIIGSTAAADAPNGDPTRAGNGILVDNSSGGAAYAATTVTNSGLIEGQNGVGIKMVGTFANTVTNNAGGTIKGTGTGAGAAIQTGDGADTVTNAGSIVGGNGAAIDLQGGNDKLTITGGAASITGSISGGSGSNTLTFNLGAGNSFAYSGAISNFDTVEVTSGKVTLSGVSTYTGTTQLSGGQLTLDGVNRLAAASPLSLLGGVLQLLGSAGADGQSFASFALGSSSVIDLGFGTLTFGALGDVDADADLAIQNYDLAGTPDYAIRFAGDLSANSDFLALVSRTTVNGHTAGFRVKDGYTEIEQVPEPGTVSLFLAGIAGIFALRRTRRAGR